jgi:Glucodextranase, domain B/Bacterial Ig-like domain
MLCGGLLALMSLPATTSGAASFVMPDPTSSLYRSFVAVGGASLVALQNCSLTGNLHSNGPLALGLGDKVTGNVSAVGLIVNLGTVSGTVTSGAPARTLPVLPTQAQALAIANRVFTTNASFTNAEIDDVVFVEGDVHIHGSLDGRGTLIVLHDLSFDGTDSTHPIALAPTTRLSILVLHDLHVGQLRPLRGLLYAGHDADLGSQASFQGVLIAAHNLTLEQSSQLAFLELDTTPPVISALAPANGSLLATAQPTVSAAYADDLSGVDSASVRLLLDGPDRTSVAQVTAAGLSYTPTAPLLDGSHTATLVVRDLAGNLAQASWSFTTDVTPPALLITSPASATVGTATPTLAVSYSDVTSGVDLTSFHILLDGADLTATCQVAAVAATCTPAPLAAGPHTLAASLRDRAGNQASASLAFTVVLPPTVTITSPADGSYSRNATIQVTGEVTGSVSSLTVNGVPASLSQGGGFTATATLTEGFNQILALATDAAGDQGTAAIGVILDTTPPTLTVAAPAAGMITNQAQIAVTGIATDDNGVAALTVAGQPVALAGEAWSSTVDLAEGPNSIVVTATDVAGNAVTVTVGVTRFSVPAVAITSPSDLSYVAGTTVTVGGTISDGASVSVNGVTATASGTSFTAAGVPLVEGGNTLTATATDARGRVGIASINVVRDLTPPHLAIYTPAPGAVIGDASVTVSGLVNDIVAGTVNAGDVRVTVNGVPAAVANRSFLAAGVPLQPGANLLTAVAVDASGNQGQASVTVQQAPPAGPRVAVVSGGGQSAVIGTPLPQPLVAVLLDATGHPVPGKAVLFRVRNGDGTVDGGRRDLAAVSDANGQALAHFSAGTRAGAGNQVIEASAVGFGLPAVFLASALPGPPALIVVDSGDQQLGVAGQALPRPLVAAVVDAGANRLAGIAATFRVVKGTGRFTNGQQTMSLPTDSDGRLIATFITDPAEGVANNVVEARVDALPAGPVASFVASTWAAADPSQTAVSGVVLDNSNLPIAGVTVRLRDTALTAVTDVQGLFRIAPAPVGTLKLIVDGSTAQRPGAWPDLEFDLTTVPGRDNTLRMPIYLLPLDLATGIQVDETHGGRLTLPQLPGFALDIQPGSVTFPGGGRSGVVSVTVVHSDKVPMVPNFGQQPRLIVTIQPAGARFDPPARLTLPNVEGLAPGQVTEFYSFDHDLGHFVSIGPGTVSDDGAVVTSNVGVGILKAGWHCCGSPQGSGSPNDCPDCQDCSGSQCVYRKLCKACNNAPGEACDGQGTCRTGKELIPYFCNQPGQTISIVIGDPVNQGCNADECGAHLRVDYIRVTNTCNNVDLRGTQLTEKVDVTSKDRCTSQTGVTNSTCDVLPGNLLVLCHDDYYLCVKTSAVPMPFQCTQTNTQQLFVGGCLAETHIIQMSITRNAGGSCSGTVTRN